MRAASNCAVKSAKPFNRWAQKPCFWLYLLGCIWESSDIERNGLPSLFARTHSFCFTFLCLYSVVFYCAVIIVQRNNQAVLVYLTEPWQWACYSQEDFQGTITVSATLYSCCTFILILYSITDCTCLHVLGCSWKERAHMSVQSLAWFLKHRSGFLCGTQSYPGPSLARSSGTPGSLRDPSLMWTRSTRTRLSSSPYSSLTPSA